MTNHTAQMPAGIRFSEYDSDGSVACAHRDLSVCPACFKSTPGLVDVFEVVYLAAGAAKEGLVAGTGVTFSPGTLV